MPLNSKDRVYSFWMPLAVLDQSRHLRKSVISTKLSIVKVNLTGDKILVEWHDKHLSVFESRHLRINCGCAECVEEWSRRKILDVTTIPADLRAEDFLMVGNYAVQFLWSDSHFTGIYPFDVLRSLCQCDQCFTTMSTPDQVT